MMRISRWLKLDALKGRTDPMFAEAKAFVLATGNASVAHLQRHKRMGYKRAINIMAALEASGVVTPVQDDGYRRVLVGEEIMEKMQTSFHKHFGELYPTLPSSYPMSGVMKNSGWYIEYVWGNQDGKAYFEFIADHRMCLGDLHIRIWSDGTEDCFESLSVMVPVSDNSDEATALRNHTAEKFEAKLLVRKSHGFK